MAKLVSEQLGDKINDHVVKIFATDIDGAALSLASKGIYKTSVLTGLSQRRLSGFF